MTGPETLSPTSAVPQRLRSSTWPTKPRRNRRQKTRHAFEAKGSVKHHQRRQSEIAQGEYGVALTSLFLGISVQEGLAGTLDVGFASHDGTYSIDFAVEVLGGKSESPSTSGRDTPSGLRPGTPTPQGIMTPSGLRTPLPQEYRPTVIADFFLQKIREYQEEHFYKFVGVGITKTAARMSPQLAARLWWDLDIVPMVFEMGLEYPNGGAPIKMTVDEEADSMARKCLMFFGPSLQPRVQVGYRNMVEVDSGGHAQIACLEQYPESVGERTWEATMKYVDSLKANKTKIAFFNSTPQGGGVALMRHALIRFLRLVGVNCKWYVPKPKPEVFRITKNNHNILQGVADPSLRITEKQIHILDDWCQQNADRFWLPGGGPLSPRSQGGADVIIVDDPQMPSLVKIAKQADPDRPVVFRSHIQVRADLADQEGTPTSEVWNWIWNHVKQSDVFISHPVREFVPTKTVCLKKVGYAPATTDWLDGLNKVLTDWDSRYYIHEFNTECYKNRMDKLEFPKRDYIVQIARFDPAKGIPDVLASYAELRRKYMADRDPQNTPQLCIAGHGAVDDPDASLIYDQTIEMLETKYSDIRHDVVVMRLGPTDQLLNALISNAKVALQLSTREGFEVKVSEALHKGTPVIATLRGGIPLQVEHGKSGFLVESGDNSAVASYLNHLLTDADAYEKMSEYAAMHVSDEVSTVGNALVWLYLADALAKGEKIEPDSKWINDMAREAAELPYEEDEPKLPRNEKLDLRSPTE